MKKEQNNKLSPTVTTLMILSITLGTSPIVMPPVFLLGGIGLSIIFLIFIGFLCYIGWENLTEIISNCNAIETIQKKVGAKKINTEKQQVVTETGENLVNSDGKQQNNIPTVTTLHTQNTLDNPVHIKMPSDQKLDAPVECNVISAQNLSNEDLEKGPSPKNNKQIQKIQQKQEEESIFYIQKNYEYQEMGNVVFGKIGKIIGSILMIADEFGASISLAIINGKTMMDVFSDFDVLNSYYTWIGIFMFTAATLSFKDVQNIKCAQIFISAIRFIVLVLFICVPIYIMISDEKINEITDFTQTYTTPEDEQKEFEYKPFNFSVITSLFSGFLYTLLSHVPLGSIISPQSPQRKIKRTLIFSMILSIIIAVIISVLAILTFGGDLTNPYDKEGILFYPQMFKGKIDWMYYFTSFYIFLTIVAMPIFTIILRKNLMDICSFSSQKEKQEKLEQEQLQNLKPESERLTLKSALFTLAIISVNLIVALLFKDRIQIVINIMCGLGGTVIMIGFPAYTLLKSRQKLEKLIKENQQQYPELLQQENYHKSFFKSSKFLYGLIVFNAFLFSFNVYQIGSQLFN